MAITRPTHPAIPQTTSTTSTTSAAPRPTGSTAPASPTTAHPTTTPPTTAAALPAAQDQFSPELGSSFVHQLLGLDRDADGRISRQEFATGQPTLERISQDGRPQNRAEQSVFRAMMDAYRSTPSQPTPTSPSPTTPSTPVSPSLTSPNASATNENDPLLSYSIQDGRLVALAPHAGTSIPPLFSTPHLDANQGGLPSTLLATPTARVIHGDDPGDFYCEHMFFGAQMAASAPESSIQTNAQGEKLVGFLHVPSDAWTQQASSAGYTQEQRHVGTRQVIGAALRGYADQIAAQQTDGSIRMMLTGYDQFMSVRNNPTGDFVSHRENLDASMRAAFGDRLLTPQGSPVSIEPPPSTDTHFYRYTIRGEDGTPREIELTASRFPVDDTTINPQSSTSIQRSISRYAPHAVISMGVAGSGSYKAEHRADSGGLLRTSDSAQHSESATDTLRLRDNFSLARAIHAGQQP